MMSVARTDRIGYLGPAGSFTHTALGNIIDLFGFRPVPSSCTSITQVVEKVAVGELAAGVLPIENSVEGVVSATIDALILSTPTVGIIREISSEVSFAAYRYPGATGSPAVVGSHPHAIAQCRQWVLRSTLEVEEFRSTSEAAVTAMTRHELVAIAARSLTRSYNLDVFDDQIEDHSGQRTRFAVLARPDIRLVDGSAGSIVKATFVVTPLSPTVGTLAGVFGCLADRHLNILSVVSRPILGMVGAYGFVLSVHLPDQGAARALVDAIRALIALKCAVKWLGAYQADDMIPPEDVPAPSESLLIGDELLALQHSLREVYW